MVGEINKNKLVFFTKMADELYKLAFSTRMDGGWLVI
jgi:hypothetical protein